MFGHVPVEMKQPVIHQKHSISYKGVARRMDSYFLTTETPSHGEENKEKTPCSLHLPDLLGKSRAVPGLSPLGDRGSVVKTVGKPTKLSTPSYKSWQVQVKNVSKQKDE